MSVKEDQVRRRSIQSAWMNIVASVLLRAVTFVANAYILRCVSREVLGVGVRTTLLFDTVLFLSREAFRKACLSRPKDKDEWKRVINLVWLVLPIGVASSYALGYVWTNHLELPSETLREQYLSAVWIHCASVLIVLCTEPFYVVGQACLRVRFRAAADLAYVLVNCALQCAVVTLWPEKAVLYNAIAGVANSLVFLALHLAYFAWNVGDTNQDPPLPFSSLRDFLPSLGLGLDEKRWRLSLSFFQQGFLKQLLTEGEKYMFTWFSLMTLPEQGVYDVVANLGSIPARLFFAKLEESAHLYFSQTVSRGRCADMEKEREPSRHLHTLLKCLLLLGVVVVTFGYSYSHLLLHLYGGQLLSGGVGPALLRTHCAYVVFLAVNGVSECYAFAVMTAEEVARYNRLLAAMTAAYLSATWALAKLAGPVGFTLANVFNFAMRIAHNFRVIGVRHERSPIRPLDNLLPTKTTLIFVAFSGIVCQASEQCLYDPSNVLRCLAHVSVGAVAFLLTMLVIYKKEEHINIMFNKTLKDKMH